MTLDRRITRLVSGAAAVLTAAALVLPPTIYFFLSHQRLAGSLEAEAELIAVRLTRIIGANPDLWEYEQTRLQDNLARRPRPGDPVRRRVLDLQGGVVAESLEPLPAPWISRSLPLLDAAVPVGSIEISRSLRPLLIQAGLLGLLLLPAGIVAFLALRNFPLRASLFKPDLLFWYFGFDTHQGASQIGLPRVPPASAIAGSPGQHVSTALTTPEPSNSTAKTKTSG